MVEPEPGAIGGEGAAILLTTPASADSAETAPAVPLAEVLAEIGRPPLDVVLHAFSHIVLIRREEDVSLIEHFLDLLAGQCDRRSVQTLVDQLAKLNAVLQRGHPVQLIHRCEAVKVRIHRLLLGLGEKAGVDDLLQMLGDGRKRVREGVVETVARSGDRRALVPLIRLCHLEESISGPLAPVVRKAVADVARRSHVASDDKIFKDLTASEQAALERALGGTAGAAC